MAGSPIRVVKVGGSLLTWEPLPTALTEWLSEQSQDFHTVLIAGGGPWAELLRHSSRRFGLPESASHSMCVQAMSVTASLLADLCERPCVRSMAELQKNIGITEGAHGSTHPSNRVVLDVQQWLQSPSLSNLPQTWDVTSDSIAARLATELNASELVLLKSRLPEVFGLKKLAESGYVDRYFPTAAAIIPSIRYENLRAQCE